MIGYSRGMKVAPVLLLALLALLALMLFLARPSGTPHAPGVGQTAVGAQG